MRRRLLASLVVGGLLALPGAGVALAAAPDPGGFALSGDANASALEATMLAATFSTTPLVDGQFPHAQADVASSDQAVAHGSVFDPGALVQTLPYEFGSNCPPPSPFPQQPPPGGCPTFPRWPFGADADTAHPDARGSVAGQTVGPFAFGAGEYDLRVATGSADARAAGGRASLGPLTVASGSAVAGVRVEGSTVVSQVTDRLQGITIDGLVDIAAITGTATTHAVAGARGSAAGSLTVTGVTVAGQAAAIDDSGLHLLGQAAPLPLDPAAQALQQLQQAGISIRLLGPSRVVNAGDSAYDGAAIQVVIASPQDGSGFSVLLGRARASGVAVPFQPLFPGLGGAGTAPSLSAAQPPPLAGGASAPPAPGGTPPSGPVLRLLGLALTPRQLLLALLALLELSLLGAGAVLFWPAKLTPPAPTLRPLA